MTIVERGEEYHIPFVYLKSTVGATIYINPRRQCRISIVGERNEGDGGDGGLGRRKPHRLKGSESLALRVAEAPTTQMESTNYKFLPGRLIDSSTGEW
ncbi:hypothetical protein QJS10_CPB13g00137 [Acorus calamus]|uniref:Uncharacterized protein n=1 Tax=Acorus calamus TaxID=4465 RepID=A0AAV9DIQ1_ACOCL|nr:hypothetical protein QJS10_CPB13g00137 [Acorus calamus]